MSLSLASGIIAVALSLVALSFAIIHRNSNATNQFNQLVRATGQVQASIVALEATIASTTSSLSVLLQKNAQYQQCITDGNGECSAVTTNYLNRNVLLTQSTVTALNTSYINVLTTCEQQNVLLQMLINQTSPDPNTTTVLQSGVVDVSVGGAFNTTSPYTMYQFKSEDLQFPYVVVDAWSVNVVGTLVSPSVYYNNFAPPLSPCTDGGVSLRGVVPLISVQKSWFNTGVFESWERYCDGHMTIYSGAGSVGPGAVAQNYTFTFVL
jgi:hypothetical protein